MLLHMRYPESSGSIARGGMLLWQTTMKPSAISNIYEVRIEAKPYTFPRVWASGGAISRCENLQLVPHKFAFETDPPRVRLCLQYADWSSSQPFTETVLPWCSEWLVHFEIWMATGEWHGGGIHPRVK